MKISQKNLLIVCFLFLLLVCILCNSKKTAEFAYIGLNTWYLNMIPSLFPFMVLLNLLISTGLSYWFMKPFSVFLKPFRNTEDAGFVRVDDAGTLDITVFNGFMATPDALANKRDLVKLGWEVYYLTWQWCNESEENMQEATDLYLESCDNEGIICDEATAERVMSYYACPSISEVEKLMTEASPDDQGLYTKRELLQAEKDLLVTMDFLIGVGKYSNDDREKILDNGMMDASIAQECMEDLNAQGVQYQ